MLYNNVLMRLGTFSISERHLTHSEYAHVNEAVDFLDFLETSDKVNQPGSV
jgi:hypothetical protein